MAPTLLFVHLLLALLLLLRRSGLDRVLLGHRTTLEIHSLSLNRGGVELRSNGLARVAPEGFTIDQDPRVASTIPRADPTGDVGLVTTEVRGPGPSRTERIMF